MTLQEQVLDTWRINNRINLYLLQSLDRDALQAKASSGGREVGKQFAHLHQARMMWLKVSGPELMEGLQKVERGEEGWDPEALSAALEASSEAMVRLLSTGLETGRIRNFKPHPTAFLGYLIAHEGHHRGQILLALKQSGRKVDRAVQYGIWEWGKR